MFFSASFCDRSCFSDFSRLARTFGRLLPKLDSYEGNLNEKDIIILIPEIYSKMFIFNEWASSGEYYVRDDSVRMYYFVEIFVKLFRLAPVQISILCTCIRVCDFQYFIRADLEQKMHMKKSRLHI